jgi:quinol monooxygenase YgiN
VEALASEGHVIFIFEFRSKPGQGDDLIVAFREYDYSDDNTMHKEPAQVKDGVLCRDPADPDHFYLIGEWKSAQAHKEALARSRAAMAKSKPRFLSFIDGGLSQPTYTNVVMSTPAEYLSQAG